MLYLSYLLKFGGFTIFNEKYKNFMCFIFTQNKIFTHLPSFVLITTTTSSKLFLSQNKNTFYSTNSLQYKAHTSMIRIMCTLNDTNASKGRINFLFSWFRWEKVCIQMRYKMQHLMIPLYSCCRTFR